MIPGKFKGERLKTARIYRGMTLTDLAFDTGVTKQALSQYENGTIKPNDGTLFAIADALHFPVGYFSIANNYAVKSEATYFRSLMSTTKKARLAQTVRLEFIAQIYEVLCDYVEFRPLNLPTVFFADENTDGITESSHIEEIATQIRKFWGLDDTPIHDLLYTLEENGILITCTSLDSDKIDAFSQRTIINNGEVFFIVLSKDTQSIVRAIFDLAHELAHILLHPWSEDIESISKEDFKKRERQANMFASSLLLPKSSFGFDISRYPVSLDYYIYLKSKWKVSAKAMIYRANKLNIISPNQYQNLMKQYAKKGWNRGEPDDQIFTPKNTSLQSAVELLLESRTLSPERFLSMLKTRGVFLHPSEIENLLCLHPGILAPQIPTKQNLLQLKK